MSEKLPSSAFLFRFSAPCPYREKLWSDGTLALDDGCRIPCFSELDDRPVFADVRGAWNESGIVFTMRTLGKKQGPWCRADRLEDSDGLFIWLDTRDTHNIHRASRFCHRFIFLPTGGGRTKDRPIAAMAPINRARELPKTIRPDSLGVRSEVGPGDYTVYAFVSADALTGFEPDEHHNLGFMYAVRDRELGMQTFSVDEEFPFEEDPSTWGSLELVRDA